MASFKSPYFNDDGDLNRSGASADKQQQQEQQQKQHLISKLQSQSRKSQLCRERDSRYIAKVNQEKDPASDFLLGRHDFSIPLFSSKSDIRTNTQNDDRTMSRDSEILQKRKENDFKEEHKDKKHKLNKSKNTNLATATMFNDNDKIAALRKKRLDREYVEHKRASVLIASNDIYGSCSSGNGKMDRYSQQYNPSYASQNKEKKWKSKHKHKHSKK